MGAIGFVPMVVVATASLVAAITDLRTLKVYNWLTLPLLIAGVAYQWASDGQAGLSSSLYGALVGFGALAAPYVLGVMGAGDVKLATGLGAWLGVYPTVTMLVIGLLATACYSLGVLFWRGRVKDAWFGMQIAILRFQNLSRHFVADEEHERVRDLAMSAEGRRRLVPFSVTLAIGVFATLILAIVASR